MSAEQRQMLRSVEEWRNMLCTQPVRAADMRGVAADAVLDLLLLADTLEATAKALRSMMNGGEVSFATWSSALAALRQASAVLGVDLGVGPQEDAGK
jgi:hypothetical protein